MVQLYNKYNTFLRRFYDLIFISIVWFSWKTS